MNTIFIRRAILNAPLLLLLIHTGAPAQAQAQNRRGTPLKHAEAILGKPLTEAQKKAIKAANVKRQAEIKPIQEKYRSTVAKALGLTLAQYKAREEKLREKAGKGQ